MTTIEIIDQARNLLNEPLDSTRTFPDDTSTFWTDTALLGYLNLSQQEVANEIIQTYEEYFLTATTINVVNGTAQYALPTDFVKMRLVEDVRGAEPIEIVPIKISEKGSVGGTGIRSFDNNGSDGYYFKGTYLVLDITPTYTQQSAISLHYVKRVSDLTTASSISEIPVEHHRVLVWGIVKMALFQQQSDDAIANREFEKHLSRLRAQCEDRQIQRPRKVSESKTEWS